jgi:FKBP-type peptidyl-prolyl cis-trans isomerase 2
VISPQIRSLVLVSLFVAAGAACGDDPATTTKLEPAAGGPVVDGDTVSVFYTGTLDDGTQFDSNVGGSPLTFVVGSGQVIAGFDDAVRGLSIGDSVIVRIEPADAYGEYSEDNFLELPAEGAPEGLQVGDEVTLSNGARVVILELDGDTITVDANHPLAGEALTFEIELVAIEP